MSNTGNIRNNSASGAYSRTADFGGHRYTMPADTVMRNLSQSQASGRNYRTVYNAVAEDPRIKEFEPVLYHAIATNDNRLINRFFAVKKVVDKIENLKNNTLYTGGLPDYTEMINICGGTTNLAFYDSMVLAVNQPFIAASYMSNMAYNFMGAKSLADSFPGSNIVAYNPEQGQHAYPTQQPIPATQAQPVTQQATLHPQQGYVAPSSPEDAAMAAQILAQASHLNSVRAQINQLTRPAGGLFGGGVHAPATQYHMRPHHDGSNAGMYFDSATGQWIHR
jgi:hypothetical protein